MAVDRRFDLRNWIAKFSDTDNEELRAQTDEVARRIAYLLGSEITDITPPGAPTDLEAVAGVESVSLSWTPPGDLDVERYRVQRSLTSGGSFSTITETLDTTIVDAGLTGSTEYFYKVAAIDTSGNVGAYSAEASAIPSTSGGAGTPPAPPVNLTLVPGNTTVRATWESDDETAVSFSLQRHTSSGGPYTVVASGLTGTTYLDTGLTNSTEYFYVVTAFNSNGDESDPSLEASATPIAVINEVPYAVTLTDCEPGHGSAKLTWTPSVDLDFSKYRVRWGLVSATPTESLETAGNSTAFAPNRGVLITGLAELTKYFFTVEVEDTAGNVSAVSNELFCTTSETVPSSPTAPAAPTNFRVIEEGSGFVTLAWNLNAETDVRQYVLYRNSGSGTTGSTFAVVQHPNNSQNATGLVNGTSYQFYIQAQSTAGLNSELTGPITGTPMDQGGVVIPPGSGTGVGGLISGDTGLGPNHRAPGATFDIVLNCSGANFMGPTMWGLISSVAQNLTAGGASLVNKRIAILLPEREFNCYVSGGARGVNINSSSGGYISCILPQAEGVQWHFIGPWPTATLTDSSATAAAASKKFQLLYRDASGKTTNLGGGHTIRMDWNQNGTRFGFWWMEIQAQGRTQIAAGAHSTNAIQLQYGYLTLYGCDILQNIPFGLHPSTGDKTNTRWSCQTFGMKIDNVHYTKVDGPWNDEHLFYEHCPGIVGDSYITNCTFTRAGGQIWQQTSRVGEGVDFTNGAESAGKHYWINVVAKDWGRCNSRAASALTHYGTRRDMDLSGCTFINDKPGKVAFSNWPPADPYAAVLSPITEFENSDFITMDGETVSHVATATGFPTGKLKMRDCDVYIRLPNTGPVKVWLSPEVDIEDCGFFIEPGGAVDRGLKFTQHPKTGTLAAPGLPTFMIPVLRITGCNTNARLIALNAAHPEVPLTAERLLRVTRRPPPPHLGSLRQSTIQLGIATDTINLLNLP